MKGFHKTLQLKYPGERSSRVLGIHRNYGCPSGANYCGRRACDSGRLYFSQSKVCGDDAGLLNSFIHSFSHRKRTVRLTPPFYLGRCAVKTNMAEEQLGM